MKTVNITLIGWFSVLIVLIIKDCYFVAFLWLPTISLIKFFDDNTTNEEKTCEFHKKK